MYSFSPHSVTHFFSVEINAVRWIVKQDGTQYLNVSEVNSSI